MANVKTMAMIAIAALVFAIMFPLAMAEIIKATGSTWNAAVLTLWRTLLPVLAIISIAILFIPRGTKGSMKHPILGLYALLQKLRHNKKGVGIASIVGLIIGLFVLAIALPIAFDYLYSVNATFNATNSSGSGSFMTASNYAAVYTVFSILMPVLVMIGAVLYFIPKGKG